MSVSARVVRAVATAATAMVMFTGNLQNAQAAPAFIDQNVQHLVGSRLDRIVGGKNTAITKVPWQIWLQRNAHDGFGGFYSCGGSIINTEWVITAAHCVTLDNDGVAPPSDFAVHSGLSDLRLSSNGTYYSAVDTVIRHPNYTSNAFGVYNDVALLHLAAPLVVSATRAPIALPFDLDGEEWPANRTPLTISGWGATKTGGDIPMRLQSAVIMTKGSPTDEFSCGNWSSIGAYDSTQNLCAGSKKNGRDICQGDSGGPYAAKVNGIWTLAGITSYNAGMCGKAVWPGIAVRVTTFENWFVPAPPFAVAWTYSGNTATISWTPNNLPTASSVTGFDIFRSTDGGADWSIAASVGSSSTSTTNVCPSAQTCLYRVTAINAINDSIGPFRFNSIPSAPIAVVVKRATTASVMLSWKQPASLNESPIQDYSVLWSRSPNSGFVPVSGGVTIGTKVTFARPTSGRVYFVIRARNYIDIPGDDYGPASAVVAVG